MTQVQSFYELRDRLYATAAAGCSLIEEDFRLKRAVEAFKDLSEENKVFGRLYQMCEHLFDTDNVAEELADCIALADALAVTQGSFLDGSECCESKEANLQLEPQNISCLTLENIKEALIAAKELSAYTEEDLHRILDPRLFSVFMREILIKPEKNEEFLDCILPKVQGNLAELLKSQVNVSDSRGKNKTSYFVKMICRLYGEEENDWYLSLIEHEEYPKSIRIEAIHALACSEKNGEKLLELYKTEKAAIKKEVLITIAKLNPPEAEELWMEMAKKYKEGYEDIIACSKNDFWADFVRAEFLELIKECEVDFEDDVDLKMNVFWGQCVERLNQDYGDVDSKMSWLLKIMRKKYQLEDCFITFAKMYPAIEARKRMINLDYKENMNFLLIENLFDEDVRYGELIKKMYAAQKEFYFLARFFLALKEEGEKAFITFQEELHQYEGEMWGKLNYFKYELQMEEKYPQIPKYKKRRMVEKIERLIKVWF